MDQKLSSEMCEIKKMLMTLHRQMQEGQHRRSLGEAVAFSQQPKVCLLSLVITHDLICLTL